MKNKIHIGGGGTSNVNREAKVKGIIHLLENPTGSLLDPVEWIAFTEEQYLGTPITASKIQGCLEACDANTTCKEFLDGKNGWMLLGVEVVKIDVIKTRAGKNPGSKMARVVLRDDTCSLNAVVFPEPWAEFSSIFHPGNTLLIQAEKTKDDSLSVKKAKEIS